jgi:large subunit ribosomal protein L35
MAIRTFTNTARSNDEAVTEPAKTSKAMPMLDRSTVTNPKLERKLTRMGLQPIGSRRRRGAIRSANDIPFEQLPYQCFQEAMKVLKADREEKLKLIETERLRISNLKALDASEIPGGVVEKERRLGNMQKHLEYLKIQADINDPLVKKRFEDGLGAYFESLSSFVC